MTYDETLSYLYNSAPLFQQFGAGAYKEGLQTTEALDAHLGHPHRSFRTIHVAGTNGKGSCSHTLAAMLQCAGYTTGLYTSPHLIDFRERIRVNGVPVSKQFVVDFVERERSFFEPLHPSFFELATAMAFSYFAACKVDVAVVEVGLGGRIDCTNIIRPELCVITNISLDHTQLLGNTLAQIAVEKAGIMKEGVPVVIGRATAEIRRVFEQHALQVGAPICFAQDVPQVVGATPTVEGWIYDTRHYGSLKGELGGYCQEENTNTILTAVERLRDSFGICQEHVCEAFSQVCALTGLMGRWQTVNLHPRIVCDTGHNVGGVEYISRQLQSQHCRQLHVVIGMANDKDVSGVLALLPHKARYYFTKASVRRALSEDKLHELAQKAGLQGEQYPSVDAALQAATNNADADNDFIFVGGSTFVVADLLSNKKVSWKSLEIKKNFCLFAHEN
ncbi:MAG: folylpolyglutamate synthase/dihydrofolate synthase family protein [Bacteroidales bacterium]|nr:folylpolyglutamate synthase/dihydrofolate synthase family protein [Bacteroidales bacterium]